MKDRRINALGLSRQRRERMEAGLRRLLRAQQQERAAQYARYETCCARIDAATEALRVSMIRLDELSCGGKPFALDEFNRCRNYATLLTESQRTLNGEMENERSALDQCTAAVKRTQQEIAANHSRCELIAQRVQAVLRELEALESDASDDEALELAVARLTHDKRRST